jgi:hypothetical protein
MENIKEQLDKIQEKVFNKNYENYFLTYIESGYVQSIELHIFEYSMDIIIKLWNSENEEREWIEEKNDYEDFDIFLKRKINESIESLKTFKKLIK